MKYRVPLKNPKPDFKSFREVLEGRKRAERVHFVELLMDEEIKKYITENLLGEKWVPYSAQTREGYWKQNINFWYKMDYDYIRVSGGLNFPGKSRTFLTRLWRARKTLRNRFFNIH